MPQLAPVRFRSLAPLNVGKRSAPSVRQDLTPQSPNAQPLPAVAYPSHYGITPFSPRPAPLSSLMSRSLRPNLVPAASSSRNRLPPRCGLFDPACITPQPSPRYPASYVPANRAPIQPWSISLARRGLSIPLRHNPVFVLARPAFFAYLPQPSPQPRPRSLEQPVTVCPPAMACSIRHAYPAAVPVLPR